MTDLEPIGMHLEAAREAGYDQLRQTVAERLGPQIIESELIEQAEIALSNHGLVLEFGRLLPQTRYDGYDAIFGLKQPVQATARMIQVNVLWGMIGPSREHQSLPQNDAYYVIGQKPSQEPEYEDVLLLSASDLSRYNAQGQRYSLVRVQVSKEDMQSRDALNEQLRTLEFTTEQLEEGINPRYAHFDLTSSTYGSLQIDGVSNRKAAKRGSSKEKIIAFGLRSPNNWRPKIWLVDSLTKVEADCYNVASHLASLAIDFGLEDQLLAIFAKAGAHEEDSVAVQAAEAASDPVNDEQLKVQNEALRQQNTALKDKLFAVLSMSGLVDREALESEINEQYPDL